MELDEHTQRGLHLTDDTKRLCLLSFLDKTKTNMGKRLLREWLLHPLLDTAEINRRLDVVQTLYDDSPTRILLRDEVLQKIPDIPQVVKRAGKQLTLELVVDSAFERLLCHAIADYYALHSYSTGDGEMRVTRVAPEGLAAALLPRVTTLCAQR